MEKLQAKGLGLDIALGCGLRTRHSLAIVDMLRTHKALGLIPAWEKTLHQDPINRHHEAEQHDYPPAALRDTIIILQGHQT